MSGQEGQRGSLQGKTEEFLREFFEKGEAFVKELIDENDRLRSQLQTTPSSKSLAAGDADAGIVDRLMSRVAVLEQECDEIRRLAGSVQRASGTDRDRLNMLEQEHYNLACMYVAGMQFHNATTIDDVLRTVTEILLNFLGVGKFTIFGVDEERQVLFPVMREGGDHRELSEIGVGDGPTAALAGLGRAWKAGDPGFTSGDEIMSLPLYGGTRLVGVARLESFLEQKSEFVDGDASLLSLVSEHGGIGIETAWMRAHAKDAPLQRAEIEHLVGA